MRTPAKGSSHPGDTGGADASKGLQPPNSYLPRTPAKGSSRGARALHGSRCTSEDLAKRAGPSPTARAARRLALRPQSGGTGSRLTLLGTALLSPSAIRLKAAVDKASTEYLPPWPWVRAFHRPRLQGPRPGLPRSPSPPFPYLSCGRPRGEGQPRKDRPGPRDDRRPYSWFDPRCLLRPFPSTSDARSCMAPFALKHSRGHQQRAPARGARKLHGSRCTSENLTKRAVLGPTARAARRRAPRTKSGRPGSRLTFSGTALSRSPSGDSRPSTGDRAEGRGETGKN